MPSDAPAIDPVLLDRLAAIDSPTICNALEVLEPGRTQFGYTKAAMLCSHPDRPARIGYAKTAAIRTTLPQGEDKAALKARQSAYYDYIQAGDAPKIVVHQDLDGEHGVAACWGDVMANIHKAMGAAGVLTNGAIRDIPGMPEGIMMLATGEKVSHGSLHTVRFGGPVEVCGMPVQDGDLVHMDRNGAVVIPAHLAAKLPDAVQQVVEREQAIIKAAQAEPKDLAALRDAMGG